MKTTRFDDLMQQVLDGAASPEEEARLQVALGEDAQLRSRYQELQRLFSVLESVGEVEPPPGALEAMVRQVQQIPMQGHRGSRQSRHSQGKMGGEREGWMGATWIAIRQRLTPQLGYAFATGTIVGVALFLAIDGQPRPDLRWGSPGTVRWEQPLREARIFGAVDLEAPGSRVRARTGNLAGSFFLEFEADLSQPGTLEMQWDPVTAVVGMQRDGSRGDLMLLLGAARFDGAGETRCRLWFSEAPEGQVRVRLSSGAVTREASLGTRSDS